MARAEPAGIPDRIKLRLTSKVKQAVARRMRDAARGRHGAETTLRPSGRSRARRAVVLRRSVKADLAVVEQGVPEPLRLSFAVLTDRTILYEDAVPATALPRELPSVAQLDRDPLRNAAPNCGAAEPPCTAGTGCSRVRWRSTSTAANLQPRPRGRHRPRRRTGHYVYSPAGRKRPAMGVNCSL
jgi:hypothetical protein